MLLAGLLLLLSQYSLYKGVDSISLNDVVGQSIPLLDAGAWTEGVLILPILGSTVWKKELFTHRYGRPIKAR